VFRAATSHQDVVAITAVEHDVPAEEGIDCHARPVHRGILGSRQSGVRVAASERKLAPVSSGPNRPEGAVFLDPDCLPARLKTLTLEPAPGPLAFGVVVWITNEVFATSTTNPCLGRAGDGGIFHP